MSLLTCHPSIEVKLVIEEDTYVCFRDYQVKVLEKRGGVKDKEERMEAGEVEKEGGAKDQELKVEVGVLEKEERKGHQCERCGKKYVYGHKLDHHKTWLCKELAPTVVELEPRRHLSSNIFHLPTVPESDIVHLLPSAPGCDIGVDNQEAKGGDECSGKSSQMKERDEEEKGGEDETMEIVVCEREVSGSDEPQVNVHWIVIT